jgi:endo-1,4-beta-xylanase
VVNEAIDDDSAKFLRNSLWYQICGDDFIIKAFEYAHEADPNAVLFYNDYNTERPEKRERVYRLLKMLKDAHVPINAVGLQGHWSVYEPSSDDLIATIKDISVYPWEKSSRKKRPDEQDAYTPEIEQKQADKYAELFKIFRDYKDVITGVTFWNISDKHTWLDYYPVPGRKNYPLLFDQNLQPKKAYYKVIDF